MSCENVITKDNPKGERISHFTCAHCTRHERARFDDMPVCHLSDFSPHYYTSVRSRAAARERERERKKHETGKDTQKLELL